MKAAHRPSLGPFASSLLLLGSLACGDLKPNTGRAAGLEGADAGAGSQLSGARGEGAVRDSNAGSTDAPPPPGAGLQGSDLPGSDRSGPGGSDSSAAQSGSTGPAGEGPDAGAGSAGSVGSSDAGLSITVHGRLVNAWNVPLAGVALMLGDQQLATNDAGEFVASDVQAPYDVAFVVEETAAGGNPLVTDGWAFQGLTRSDPTFRVSRAGTTWSGNATFSTSTSGISPTGNGDPALSVLLGVGLPSGQSGGDDTLPPNGAMVLFSWSGDAQTTGVAHGLAFTTDPLRALPSGYQGYSSVPITADGTKTYGNAYSLDLTPPITAIATRELSGSVSGGSENRINQVWLSFPDHAALLLAEENPASSTFSYLVPQLEGATITVLASSGSTVTGSLALAHRNYDPSSAPDLPIEISLPDSPTLIEPWSAATLAPATVFGWQSENAVSVLTLIQDSPTGPHRIHVVTAEKTAQIPEFLSRSLLQAGDAYWRVETHSLATDLDAVTSAPGFLDPFAESSAAALAADGFYATPSAQLIVVPASP